MRRSNLLTLRKFFSWNSEWYSSFSYQLFVLRDHIIVLYLTSIFKRCRICTSQFRIRHRSLDTLMIECDLYVSFIFKIKKYISIFSSNYLYLLLGIYNYMNTNTVSVYTPISNVQLDLGVESTNNFFFLYTCIYYKLNDLLDNFFFKQSFFLYQKHFFFFYYFYIKNNFFIYIYYIIYIFFYFSFIMKDSIFSYKLFFYSDSVYRLNTYTVDTFSILGLDSSLITDQPVYVSNHNTFLSFFNIRFDFCHAFIRSFYSTFHNSISSSMYYYLFFVLDYFRLFSNPYTYRKLFKLNNFFLDNKFMSIVLKFKYGFFFFFWIFKTIVDWLLFIYNFYIKTKVVLLESTYSEFIYLLYDISNIKNDFLYFNKYEISFFFKNNMLLLYYIWTFNNIRLFFYIYDTKEVNYDYFFKQFKYLFFLNFFDSFFSSIEKTLFVYTDFSYNIMFIPNFFFLYKPYILSAKLVTDFIYFQLKKWSNVERVYNSFKRWQIRERSLFSRLFKFNQDSNSTKKTNLLDNIEFHDTIFYRSPLKGIRILCSGPPRKAKRKLKNFYHIWVANIDLTGRMPLQSINYAIEYYQTIIVLKRASLGLKTWVLLESYVQPL